MDDSSGIEGHVALLKPQAITRFKNRLINMSQINKISRNNTTQANYPDGSKAVTLHATEVIRYWPEDRKVRLNTGGCNTTTTRTRMNQAMNKWDIPACVSFADGKAQVGVNSWAEVHDFSRDGICYFSF